MKTHFDCNRSTNRRFMALEQVEERLCLSAATFVQHSIVADDAIEAVLADVDGDEDLDVVLCTTHDQLVWHENTDGHGHFGPSKRVADFCNVTESFIPEAIEVADLDGDGDNDILSSRPFAWHENLDGQGRFGEPRVISNEVVPRTLSAGDLDADGDIDLVVSASGTTWYENRDGEFSPRIDFGERGEYGLSTLADVDNDDDLDILASLRSNESATSLFLSKNLGDGSFGEPREIVIPGEVPYPEITSLNTSDIDGDGDADLVVGEFHTFVSRFPRTVWFKNIESSGEMTAQFLDEDNGNHVVETADVDGDGDLDVIGSACETGPCAGTEIRWYENFGRNSMFSNPRHIAFADYLRGTGDLDGDGDDDFLIVGFETVWYEYRLIGDSNDDGLFDSSDLVAVFQAGKYEDGIANNATFDEGDWNQDGDFDSSDLVLAFQAGHYVAAARPSVAEIAAAVDWLFDQDEDEKKSRAFVA